MKTCLLCQKEFKTHAIIDGKRRSFTKRKYCLECSPFGFRNTKTLNKKIDTNIHPTANFGKYKSLSLNDKKLVIAYQAKRRKTRRKQLILRSGGKCQKCGYDKNMSCLSFHHKTPKEKKFELSASVFGSKSMEELEKEADKCALLCCRCHTELHHPEHENWK